jgi:cellulose synthase/poly-beta-1,6-N-acetylglucosamine synthase-like glycosyltransferase
MKLKNNIVVTIGFCIKNVEKTVSEAINSIVQQDFPHEDMEIIVVEGFSNDRTLSIVQKHLNNTPIIKKVLRENSGLGMARQIVVDNARGQYIIWVDGDMVLPMDYVREQVKFMENNPKVGIAGGKYRTCLGKGLVADLENIVYVVDSTYGELGASKFGYLPGTEGSIYRMEAIRQIGGFDVGMKGAAEDTDIAYRLRAKGWELAVTKEMFTESTRKSWVSLWDQYFWYGRGGHYVLHKNNGMITLWKMTPIAGFFAGLLRCSKAYQLLHNKIVFMLPIHYTFKRIAWFFGFTKAHAEGYGHNRIENRNLFSQY